MTGSRAVDCCIGGGGPAGTMAGLLTIVESAHAMSPIGLGVCPEHIRSPKRFPL